MKFTVLGCPIPQGSMRAFIPRNSKLNRPIITSDNPRLKQWRQAVRAEAIKAMGYEHPAGSKIALRVEALFFLPRAKSNKAIDAIKRPDIDKLLRACLDAMTQVVYDDDSQIIEAHVFKCYGNPRVEIKVEEVGLVPTLLEHQPKAGGR